MERYNDTVVCIDNNNNNIDTFHCINSVLVGTCQIVNRWVKLSFFSKDYFKKTPLVSIQGKITVKDEDLLRTKGTEYRGKR